MQVAIFGEQAAGPRSSDALMYAPLPLLLWAAVRFGIGGMCLSLLIFALLSHCQTIVASHGGSLEARRNRDNGGMTFSFSLPEARNSEGHGPRPPRR